MEFKFTKEEEDIRRAANDFAQRALANKELEKLDHVPVNTLTEMGDLGFLGLMVPETYGGEPAGWVEVGIVAEEIAKGNIAMAYLIDSKCYDTSSSKFKSSRSFSIFVVIHPM